MKKWKCTVCDYIYEGMEPPETCPVCGVSKEFFEEITGVATGNARNQSSHPSEPVIAGVLDGGNAKEALFKISYGLYIVSSVKDGKLNGQICNTVFQITSEPQRVALGINKHNLTHEYITTSGIVAITILGEDNINLVKHFGFQSGRKVDKFQDQEYSLGKGGCPVITKGLAYLECRVITSCTQDLGTHTLFIAEVVDGDVLRGDKPITYEFYRNNRA